MKYIFISFLLLFIVETNGQSVNLKNGNCYISYSDLNFSGYDNIKDNFLVRTYNSKSTTIGWFGYGWGSSLETKLYFYPDYSVMIKEHGGGGSSIYTSAIQDDVLTEELIETILDTEIEHDRLKDLPTVINARRQKLLNFKEVRLATYNKYVKEGYLEAFEEIPEAVTWQSFARGSEKQLVFENDQFIRTSRDGKKEYFDIHGNLTKVIDVDGKRLEVSYQNDDPTRITSPGQFYVDLTTDKDGFITRLKASDGQEAELRYENDNLVFSEDAGGHQYGYAYDSRHNLTKVVYNPVRLPGIEEDAALMEYHPETYYLSKITSRDGEVVTYNYKNFFTEDGKKDDDHYATTVTKTGWDGRPVENYYEYLIGSKPNGTRYTKKIITRINGIQTTTTYDENCSGPTRIERGDRWAEMVFDKNCNMVEKKRSNGEHLKLEYHPTLKKLTRVEQGDVVNIFEYNEKGKVTLAQKNDNEPIILKYDDRGEITQIISGEKKLDFEYNKMGKPTRIVQEGLGEMTVTYDDYGDILKVESSDGSSAITLQITQTFQKLLSLVKVPNVDFNL